MFSFKYWFCLALLCFTNISRHSRIIGHVESFNDTYEGPEDHRLSEITTITPEGVRTVGGGNQSTLSPTKTSTNIREFTERSSTISTPMETNDSHNTTTNPNNTNTTHHSEPSNKTTCSSVYDVCPYRCKDGEDIPSITSQEPHTFECFNCTCHSSSSTCMAYGTCCPDVDDDLPRSHVMESSTQVECNQITNSSGQPRKNDDISGCYSNDLKNNSFLYVRSCSGKENQGKSCTAEVPPSELTFAKFTMVMDTKTNVVYLNKFCASCNGVCYNSMRNSSFYIRCDNYMTIYRAKDRKDLFKLVMKNDSTCSIAQGFEEGTVSCDPAHFSANVVDACPKSSDPASLVCLFSFLPGL